MTVTKWPSYLLRQIPADTRALLSEQAEADDVSLSDVIRQALCHHYRMDCEPESFGYQSATDSGSDVILAGACIVRSIMEKLDAQSMTVSDRGLRHGVLIERFGP